MTFQWQTTDTMTHDPPDAYWVAQSINNSAVAASYLAVFHPLSVRCPNEGVLVAEAQLPQAYHEVYAQEEEDRLHGHVQPAERRVVLVPEPQVRTPDGEAQHGSHWDHHDRRCKLCSPCYPEMILQIKQTREIRPASSKRRPVLFCAQTDERSGKIPWSKVAWR